VIVAMPTPMQPSGTIDLGGTARLTEWLIGKDVNALFVCGTTGEGALLDDRERVETTRAAVNAARGRVPVVAHAGAVTTAATVDLAKRCVDAGADALAVVTPYYFRYRDEELIAHYAAVTAAVPDHPVLAYNIPALTGNAVTPTVARILRDRANLVGVKDSTGDAYGLLQLGEAGGSGFHLIVGADLLVLEVLAMGWAGMVSGPAAAIPEPYVALWKAVASSAAVPWPQVASAYRQVAAVCHALHNGSDIPRIKAVLHLRGVIGPYVRAPLQPLAESELAEMRKVAGEEIAMASAGTRSPRTPTRSRPRG
jgi:4-hydroxy-tetrahydrodipicolinate synthase